MGYLIDTCIWIDVEQGALTCILTGGSRSPRPSDTWALDAGGGRMLLHIGGTGMAMLDTHTARLLANQSGQCYNRQGAAHDSTEG